MKIRKNRNREDLNYIEENTTATAAKRRRASKLRTAILSVLLALSLAGASFGFSQMFAPIYSGEVGTESVDVASAATMEEAWVNAAKNGGTCKLTGNWTATANSNNGFGTTSGYFLSGALYLNTGKEVTLDLAGYTLNRNNSSTRANGGVIVVASGKLTIKGTGTIRGGWNKTTGNTGGGGVTVYGAANSVTIENGVTITACKTSVANTGAAINVQGGATVTMTGGSVTGNSQSANVAYSGALYSAGASKLNFTSVSFTSNTTPYTNSAGAVCLYGNTGAVNFTSCTFSSNSTANSNGGGAIYSVNSNNVKFTSCTIQSNSNSSTTGAAGVYIMSDNAAKTITFDNCTINSNTMAGATGAGGLHANGAGIVNITNGKIQSNKNNATGSYTAGGIFCMGGAVININGTTISGNTAAGSRSGGGICLGSSAGTVTMSAGTISGNTATGANSGGGVGVQISGSVFQITGGAINGTNKGSFAGGVFAWTGGVIQVGGTAVISGNYLANGTTTCNVAFYTTTQVMTVVSKLESGASIGVTKLGNNYNSSLCYITSGFASKQGDTSDDANKYFFPDNATDYQIGRWGACDVREGTGEAKIFCINPAKNWEDCVLAAGSSQQKVRLWKNWSVGGTFTVPGGSGAAVVNGAVAVSGAYNVVLDLQGFTLSRGLGSNATNGYAMYLSGGTYTIMDSKGGGKITGGRNNNNGNGGGIYLNSGTLNFNGGEITGNVATNQGAGVYVQNATFNMNGGKITNNSGPVNGGGVFIYRGTFNMYGGEISGNTAQNGGGVYVSNYSTSNTLFYMRGTKTGGAMITGNRGTTQAGGVWLNATYGLFYMGGNSAVYDNWKGSSGTAVGNKSNVYFALATQMINVISQMTATHKTGVTRATIGPLTTGWKTNNAGVNPETMFTADDSNNRYVVEYASGEAALLSSTNNADNWLEACIGSKADGTTHTVKLVANWTLTTALTDGNGYWTGCLYVQAGVRIKLDLAGFTINGNRGNSAVSPGCVIRVNGSLEIIDSSTAQTGTITGGYNSYSSSSNVGYRGSGICVYSGTLTMRGGNITGNKISTAYGGAGVQLFGGTFTMYGGKITGNTQTAAQIGAGGVFVQSGTFNMYGGEISGNSMPYYAAAVANGATNAAAGVCINDGAVMNIKGNVKIQNNNFTGTVDGADIIFTNMTATLNVVGAIDASSRIGIRREMNNYTYPNGQAFTKNFTTYNKGVDPTAVFFASEKKRHQMLTDQTEATLWCIDPGTNWANCYNAGSGTVRLYANWTASGGNFTNLTNVGLSGGRLYIPSGKNMTVDLNGFTLSRGRTGAADNGQVFYLRAGGTLTIRDTRGAASNGTVDDNLLGFKGTGAIGKITGGYNNAANGGGIFAEGGTLNLYGGEVTGNKSSAAGTGGVHLNSGVTFNMGNHAAVYDNYHSNSVQGNVYCANTAQIINIASRLTSTHKTGVTRNLIGVFTSNWKARMPANREPDSMFVSDTSDKYVMTYATGEGAFLSYNNDENWTLAVKNSIAEKNTHTVTLCKNWSGALGSDGTAYWVNGLYVPAGASVILDLAGYTINRGLTAATSGGNVIRVEGGTLVIKDSKGGGVITGGFNSHSSRQGGGISLYSSGSLTLEGGTISGNKTTTANGGGGVWMNGGTFTMTGGKITGNSNTGAQAGAGGVSMTGGTFNFYGGEITGNNMPYYIGALDTSTKLTPGAAAGVNVIGGRMNIQGNVKIQSNNFTGGQTTASDLYITNNKAFLYVTGKLANTSRIGLRREINNYTTENINQVMTSGFNTYNKGIDPTTIFFASENGRHRLLTGRTEATLWCIDSRTNWTNCYNNGGGTVTLYSNWTTTSSAGNGFSANRLYIYGQNMTLDLNGFTVNRGLTGATDNGQVVWLRSGTFTLKDSKGTAGTDVYGLTLPKTEGKLTGGFNNAASGGGIYAQAGTLNLYGGEITGNKTNQAQNATGGGVHVASGVVLNLSGNISVHDNLYSNNKASSDLFCANTSQMMNVAGKLTSTKKINIIRDKNGVFTTNFGKNNPGKSIEAFFDCNETKYFVYDSDEITATTNEGSLLTTDNSTNWHDAVVASQNANGATQSVRVCKDWFPTSGNSFGTTSSFYSGAMYVPSNASIILDLNGCTIDRKLTSAISHGYLFRVNGKLTIKDSKGGGIITGGFNNYNSLNGYAGGAFALLGGSLTIQGGKITGNKSSAGGAGIGAIAAFSTLIIQGGEISGNQGAYVGGVYSDAERITVSGSTKITGNTIFNNASKASNVYFGTQTHRILIGGVLGDDARIGITRTGNIDNYSSDNVITANYVNRKNTASKANLHFTSDSTSYIIQNTASEAKIFCVNPVMNWHNAVAKNNNSVVKLYADWNAVSDSNYGTNLYYTTEAGNITSYFRNGGLYLPANRTVTIDLNGFNIDRKLTANRSNGYVMYILGNLNIIDSSVVSKGEAQQGKITGGRNSDGAGGIFIDGSGTVKISGGSITNNFGKTGAGVYVNTNGKLYLGGTVRIENNKNLSNGNSNIYLAAATQVVYINAKIETGRVFGLTRAANGEVTSGWFTYNRSKSPEDYFVSEHPNYDTMTSANGELYFLSGDNSENWQTAVTVSLATKTAQSVKLCKDWIATNGSFGSGTGYYGGCLYVPAGASVMLDTNGYKIDRGLKGATSYGGIFRINGTLEIKNRKYDGTEASKSIITGGWDNGSSWTRGGGAHVISGGSLTISGVNFYNNKQSANGEYAGGIYVAGGGSLTLKDASVTNNVANGANSGGGVLVGNGGRINVGGMTVIENNKSSNGSLKRDVTFITVTDKIYVNATLTDGAHIGVYKLVNNYTKTSNNHDIVSANYSKYNNTSDATKFFFASDSPFHDVVTRSNEAALKCYDNATNWANAIVASASKQETFTLYSNWTATNGMFTAPPGNGNGFYNGALRVPTNRNLIINLNGWTINRARSNAPQYGFVLYVQSRLQIIDQPGIDSDDRPGTGVGTITGGWSTANTANGGYSSASGIWIASGTTTITGGNITGNKNGYGVYVNSGAYLELGGSARILGNGAQGVEFKKGKDINIVNNTANVNIVSKFTSTPATFAADTSTIRFGISRAANGTFTTNYGKFNSDINPDQIFISQNDAYYVTDNEETGDKLQGFFLSTNPAINWTYAVTQSINNNKRPTRFTLKTPWNATNGSFGSGTGFRAGQLYVPSNASIILDLNGYTINKGNYNNRRSILFIDGDLVIKDSQETGNVGKITGGIITSYSSNQYDRSGGITVRYGKVTMQGGLITGNTTNNLLTSGGGVYVYSGATFEMFGGEITNNSGYRTGGVYVVKGGRLNLGGSAKIYGNPSLNSSNAKAGYYGDVYFQNTDAGYATITQPFDYDDNGKPLAKIGVLADTKKILAAGTVITSGFSAKNPDKDPTEIFVSNETTEYGIDKYTGGGKTEAVLICLNNAINWTNAVTMSINQKNTQTFRLYSDWTPDLTGSYPKMFGNTTGYRYGALRVPSSASIILDLHGFSIDRQMTSAHKYGYVLFLEGKLQIIDSTATVQDDGTIKQGQIRGGYCSANGYATAGAIFAQNSSTLQIFGGAITGNKINDGNNANARSGAVTVNSSNVNLQMGGTAQIYGNTNTYSNTTADLHMWGNEQMIKITQDWTFDTKPNSPAGTIGVMRGTLNGQGKPNGIGQFTQGWGEHVTSGDDPADRFTPNGAYLYNILVSSLDFDTNCEGIILSNDNFDNWVYAVNTSLQKNMTTRFILMGTWTAPAYTKYNYYKTSFGQVANAFVNGGLHVPAGASIVMDLNGGTIDRNHNTTLDTQYASYNYTILVRGSLQIVDSKSGGKITGGSYGVQVADNGFVCMGALPEDVNYMTGNGKQYVKRDTALGGGSITGNSINGVYAGSGAFAMTSGSVTGNGGTNVQVGSNTKIMLGGNANVYTNNANKKDLVLSGMFTELQIISPFTTGAKFGVTRDSLGQLTNGWGAINGDSVDPTPYFVLKNTDNDKYYVEVHDGEDGHKEVFLTSYDNELNWQYAVSSSLATKKTQTFIMYGCWVAKPDATNGTSFGKTSAFINGALYVPAGASVIMEMNGHRLDRNLTSARANGYIIYIEGSLEIKNVDRFDPTSDDVTIPACDSGHESGVIRGGNNNNGSSAGAIHLARGTLTVNDITIKSNTATSDSASAGAIFVNGTFNFNSGVITENTGKSAGAVYVTSSGKFNMPANEDGKTATITANNANTGGGAIYTAGTTVLESGTISKNKSLIGGVYAAGGKLTISGSATVTENTGVSAGGVYVTSNATLEMSGGAITDNVGDAAGGIYVAGRVNMTGGEITGNTAKGGTGSDDGGSGMYLTGSANVTITGGKITRNIGRNGVRVYSSGSLSLGGSAYIAGNETTDNDVKAVSKDGTCDVHLTADSRKITIVSQFTEEAHIGVYRSKAGIFTKNYGQFNEAHPDNFFFSNKSIYAVAVTSPEQDEYAEAVIGTPTDAPVEYKIAVEGSEEKVSPTYHGDYQKVITNYNTKTMTVALLPDGVKATDPDENGICEIHAVNAGSYLIAFVLGEEYCWKDGTIAPKQLLVNITPKTIAVLWTDEKHYNEETGKVDADCKYDGSTVHAPSAAVDETELVVNVLTGEKDKCDVTIDGATIYASGKDGHKAVATMLSNSNYAIDKATEEYTFHVGKANLPAFVITTEEAEYKTDTTIRVDGNLENGTLHFSLPDNPANVTIDENTGVLNVANKELVSETVKVKVKVDETANYYDAETEREIAVLPGKVQSEFEVTEVVYGEELKLALKDYDADEMGDVTYAYNCTTGIASVSDEGLLSGTKKVGEVEVTATIAATKYYVETVIEGIITITPRVITVDWGVLKVDYDGNVHSPSVSVKTESGAGIGVLDGDTVNLTVYKRGTDKPASFTYSGEYGIQVELSNKNYKLADDNAYFNTYTIDKAELTLSLKETTAYYKTAFTPDLQGNLGKGAVTYEVVETSLIEGDANTAPFTPNDIGKLTLKVAVAETANYKGAEATFNITVDKAPMKLELTTTTVTYGDKLVLAATSSEDEAAGGIGFAVKAGSTDKASIARNLGVYTLTAKYVGDAIIIMTSEETDHYKAASIEATVTITPRAIKIVWSNLSFEYDGDPHKPTASLSTDAGLLEDDEGYVDVSAVTVISGKGRKGIDAGNHVAQATLSHPCYTPDTDSLEVAFEITPYAVEIEWETGKTYYYNGEEQAPKATINADRWLWGEDKCDVIVLGSKHAATGITAMATGVTNENYTLKPVNLTTTFDILPYEITVTWSNLTFEYDGEEHAPTATSDKLFGSDTCEITVIGAQTNVGTYEAEAFATKNPDYKLKPGMTHSTEFTITPGKFTVTLVEGTVTYGDTYQLEVQGAPEYALKTYTLGDGAENVILSGDRLITMNTGKVTVTVTVAATDNYGETSDTKVITILPRPVVVSWENLSFEYDKEEHVPEATISNLVNSDSCNVTVEGAATDAGTHTATVTEITNAKYVLVGGTDVSKEFVITPKKVEIKWGTNTEGEEPTDDDINLTYNGKEQHPVITITNLYEGDECNAVVKGARDAGVDLTATLTGVTNSNYTIENVDNTTILFNIARVIVTIQWSGTKFIYNGEEQGPTAVVTNLCEGDACTVTVSGWEVEVGDNYIASAIGLSNDNYALPERNEDEEFDARLDVKFSISKAEREFSLASDRTVYGTDLALNVVGLGEDDVVTFTLANGTGSATLNLEDGVLHPTAAGTVKLTVSIAATDNYDAASEEFTITIDKCAVEIEWTLEEYVYNGDEQKPVAKVVNAVVDEDGNADVVNITGINGATDAGTQTAEVTAIGNDNYTLEGGRNVTTTFTISPKPVTIVWGDKTVFTYSGTEQGPTATAGDLIGTDTCDVVVSGYETDAGSYTATAASLSNPNYTLEGVAGLTCDYVINRADVDIKIVTTTATLGVDCDIEISGNTGNGDVLFEILEGNDIAYISGTKLVSQKVGRVKVKVTVGETVNTFAGTAEGYIDIEKGTAPLVMDRTVVTYGNTLTLAVDDNDGFLRDDSGNLLFGDVTFTLADGEEDKAVIESGNVLRPLKAGSVKVVMSVEESANYNATSVEVVITVNKRIVTLDWTDETFTYNKTEQAPVATVTNLVGEDKVTVTVKGATEEGTWTAQATGLSDEDNYTLVGATNTTKEFKIDAKPVDINWGELVMEFNGKDQLPEAWVVTIDDEDCTVILEGGGRNVGKHKVTATGLSNHNYVLTEDNLEVEMEITPAHLTIELSPTTAVYGVEETLTVSGNLENGAVTYTVIQDEEAGNATITGDKFMPTRAGNVVVKIVVAATDNCYGYEGEAIIFVEKAERTSVALIDDTTVYGETLKLEISGNLEDGDVSYTVANGADDDSEARATISGNDVLVTKHAGTVYVTVTIAATQNYKETVVSLPVTIDQRIAIIAWGTTEFKYTGNYQVPDATVSNLLEGDECGVRVSGAQKNAGNYTATVSELLNPDYKCGGATVSRTSTLFNIGKTEIDIELENSYITIEKVEKLSVKGNKGDGEITYVVTNGLGEAVITDAEGTVAADGQYIKGTKLGTVIVTVTVKETANYLGNEIKALVIIQKDVPKVTLKQNTVMYGEELVLGIDGFVEGGRVSYTVSNASGQAIFADGKLIPLHVGEVNVTVSTGETDRYSATTTTLKVTITPRPLTMIEWDEDTLEFTYDGISIFAPTGIARGTVNNEECGVVVTGGKTAAGVYPAGTAYAVSLTNPNYTLEKDGAKVEGWQAPEFEITKAKPVIKILTTTITIDVPTIILISGNNDNAPVRYMLENGTGEATLVGNVITGTKLGEVYLTVSVNETDNYLFGSASAVILVEKPEAPIELEDVETIYGTDLTLNVLNEDDEGGAVTIALKEGTTLATLSGNVLTPKGVGKVTVIVTVAATESYRETVIEFTVTILPKPVELTWEYPEFVYDGEEHAPVAKVGNIEEGDECTVTVSGAINAGTDCEATATALSNPNYTLEEGTNVTTTFVIKPRPVKVSWTYPENGFTYNGKEQAPAATVENAIGEDVVKITKVNGSKDAGVDLTATAVETDNTNYTCEGGENVTTLFTINPFEIEIEWGDEFRLVYNGKQQAPAVKALGTFGDELALAEVAVADGEGIHVREEPYTGTLTGKMLNTNYKIKDGFLDGFVLEKEFWIIPATVTIEEAVLVKEYLGTDQMPDFTITILGEDDDIKIVTDKAYTDVGKYPVELKLEGASAGDYVLAEADLNKLFEITRKKVTLKVDANDRAEQYTGKAIDVSAWEDWYTMELLGLLDPDADKDVDDVFRTNTLVFVPKIYEAPAASTFATFALETQDSDVDDSKELKEVVDMGKYLILPSLRSGVLTDSTNYVLEKIVDSNGTLLVCSTNFLELTEESKYQFIYERVNRYGFRYVTAYEQEGLAHGVDDLMFENFILGQILTETTIDTFLSNIKDVSLLKLYTHDNLLIYENGQPVEGYDELMDSSMLFVGTGWRVEYGEGDDVDIVYISVLGDLDGDGMISTNDTLKVSSFIAGNVNFGEVLRLSAMISNTGSISATDLSVLSGIISNADSGNGKYFTYVK